MPTPRALRAIRDPIVWSNLGLRIILLVWIISQGHGVLGDTEYYLQSARHVCAGAWGGDLYRGALYPWFLYAASFGTIAPKGLAFALIVQSLASWISGVWLASRSRLAAFLWLWDPVLLVYSGILMSDSLFALFVLLLALQFSHILLKGSETGVKDGCILGLLFALVMLERPIGEPLLAVTAIFLATLVARKKAAVQTVIAAICMSMVLITPRLSWVHARSGHWKLDDQSTNILKAIAGGVQYSDAHVTFFQAESTWAQRHPGATGIDAIQAIAKNSPRASYLIFKSVARILAGHVNVEWIEIATGKNAIGPGWFKAQEKYAGPRISGPYEVTLWCVGILVTLLFCGLGYWALWKKLRRGLPGGKPDPVFFWWCLIAAAALVASPIILGDARFRAPVWALLVALLLSTRRNAVESSTDGRGARIQ